MEFAVGRGSSRTSATGDFRDLRVLRGTSRRRIRRPHPPLQLLRVASCCCIFLLLVLSTTTSSNPGGGGRSSSGGSPTTGSSCGDDGNDRRGGASMAPQCASSSSSSSASAEEKEEEEEEAVPDGCRTVIAPSSAFPGWGIFTLVDRRRGEAVLPGDVVLQLSDVVGPGGGAGGRQQQQQQQQTEPQLGMGRLLSEYLWSSEETGGFYEGQSVISVLPGVGMLANGLPSPHSNVLPFVPSVDEAGLTRKDSPGAGAITHYHNYTFFVQRDIAAGGEILVNYGTNFFRGGYRERRHVMKTELPGDPSSTAARDVEWLRRNGICVDSIKAGRSSIPHAGRGAFASRSLPAGSRIAPVPVVPVASKDALRMSKQREPLNGRGEGEWVHTQQLMLNYLYGHNSSSLLLYPYSPMVNLLNHASGRTANARLRWSTSGQLRHRNDELLASPDEWPLERIQREQPWGLLLELVATRDIRTDEEILVDYGRPWVAAWLEHVRNWKPARGSDRYAPSYVHEDAIKSLRPQAMLKEHPYPSNIFTSCFYRYADHREQAERTRRDDPAAVTTFQWNQSRGIFELSNLRPCTVLKRQPHDSKKAIAKKKGNLFTVQILNRYGLPDDQRIPRGAAHIVTDVPRTAIRFSDKIYTTDQHLTNAFRYASVDLGDLFPRHWLDLAPSVEDEGDGVEDEKDEAVPAGTAEQE